MGKLCQVLENDLELMGGLSKESVLKDTMWATGRNLEPKISNWRLDHGLRIIRKNMDSHQLIFQSMLKSSQLSHAPPQLTVRVLRTGFDSIPQESHTVPCTWQVPKTVA